MADDNDGCGCGTLIVLILLIIIAVNTCGLKAEAQAPPTAAEMIDGAQYLNNSELVAVSDAIMARRAETNPLGVVATNAYWTRWIYGDDWDAPPPLLLPDIPWADRLELFLRTEWGGGILIGEYAQGEAYPVLELFVVGVKDSTLYSLHPTEFMVRVVE